MSLGLRTPKEPATHWTPAPPSLERPLTRIAEGGFGDGWNAYPHSMAWFRGALYVGTTRANLCSIKAARPPGFVFWPIRCPDDVYDIDRRAEIWRFDPGEGSWQRIYQSPWADSAGLVPRDIGYRGMRVSVAPVMKRGAIRPPWSREEREAATAPLDRWARVPAVQAARGRCERHDVSRALRVQRTAVHLAGRAHRGMERREAPRRQRLRRRPGGGARERRSSSQSLEGRQHTIVWRQQQPGGVRPPRLQGPPLRRNGERQRLPVVEDRRPRGTTVQMDASADQWRVSRPAQ